jgi:hypothetical protein
MMLPISNPKAEKVDPKESKPKMNWRGFAKSSSLAALALLATPLISHADSPGEPGRDAGGKNPLNNVYFG